MIPELEDEHVQDQGVITRFIPNSTEAQQKPAMIELLYPTAKDTPIGKFIEKRGVGFGLGFRAANDIYHSCLLYTSPSPRD